MVRKPLYLTSESNTQNRWLISYTDIVTILLILFVAIAAQSLRNRQQNPSVTAEPTAKAQPASRNVLLQAEQRLKQRGLDPRLEERGLIVSLPQAILFPSGEDRVSPAAFPLISEIAGVLQSIENKVVLVGHADARPIHTRRFRNNWELSAARGLSLLAVLSTRFGIPESRLSVSSYGSYSPKNPNDTEDGRAGNRRVEILILNESAATP